MSNVRFREGAHFDPRETIEGHAEIVRAFLASAEESKAETLALALSVHLATFEAAIDSLNALEANDDLLGQCDRADKGEDSFGNTIHDMRPIERRLTCKHAFKAKPLASLYEECSKCHKMQRREGV